MSTPEPQDAVRVSVRRRVTAVVATSGTAPVPLADLCAAAGLPESDVRRLVDLGLLEPAEGPREAPCLPPDTAGVLARASRLRRDLGLGWSGALLASQLLARIEELEERLRAHEGRSAG